MYRVRVRWRRVSRWSDGRTGLLGRVYDRSAVTEVSWFQGDPVRSTELIAAAGVGLNEPIIDVGGGASVLVDRLLDAGQRDVTVLDVAADALAAARSRVGPCDSQVPWITADLLAWEQPTDVSLARDTGSAAGVARLHLDGHRRGAVTAAAARCSHAASSASLGRAAGSS